MESDRWPNGGNGQDSRRTRLSEKPWCPPKAGLDRGVSRTSRTRKGTFRLGATPAARIAANLRVSLILPGTPALRMPSWMFSRYLRKTGLSLSSPKRNRSIVKVGSSVSPIISVLRLVQPAKIRERGGRERNEQAADFGSSRWSAGISRLPLRRRQATTWRRPQTASRERQRSDYEFRIPDAGLRGEEKRPNVLLVESPQNRWGRPLAAFAESGTGSAAMGRKAVSEARRPGKWGHKCTQADRLLRGSGLGPGHDVPEPPIDR